MSISQIHYTDVDEQQNKTLASNQQLDTAR